MHALMHTVARHVMGVVRGVMRGDRGDSCELALLGCSGRAGIRKRRAHRLQSLTVLRGCRRAEGNSLDSRRAVSLSLSLGRPVARRHGPLSDEWRLAGAITVGLQQPSAGQGRREIASAASKPTKPRARVRHDQAKLHADENRSHGHCSSHPPQRVSGRDEAGDSARPQRAHQPQDGKRAFQ